MTQVVPPLKLLKASAGSGKTFSLTAHYLTLLFAHEHKYREILAVTFTNKATEEMKTRILEVLEGLAQNDPSDRIDAYRKIIVQAHTDLSTGELQEKAARIYRRILHDYSRFSVSTIDGFVQKVVRSFAFELGLESSYSLEMNIDKVKENLVDRLDKELDSKPELVDWVIQLAKERIEEDKNWNYKGELLGLAGEIFKERFADFERALQQIGYGQLDKVFADYAQDTRRFIREVEEHLLQKAQTVQQAFVGSGLVQDDLKQKSRNPLTKLSKILRKEFQEITALAKLIDQPESWFQKGVDDSPYYTINPQLKELYDYYITKRGAYILAQQFQQNVYFLRLMQEMAILLKTYRDETGNLLISDAQSLLTGITEDAGDNPSFIWEKIGNRYKNFLFDEFQDTSVAQWDSFRSLVQNALATPSRSHVDHLVVGDTKQSIYRWRNGDWRILESRVKEHVGSFNVIEQSLEENYRSSSEIIAFNNGIYSQLPGLVQQKLNDSVEKTENPDLIRWWNDNNYQHIIADIYKNATQHTHSHTKEGGIIKMVKIAKPEDEERMFSDTLFQELAVTDTVQEIRRVIDELGYAYEDIGILVRRNAEATMMVEALMEARIPVVSGDALMLAGNSAIQLIINTLYVLVGYENNTSLYKAECLALYARIQGVELAPEAFLDLRSKSLSDLSDYLPPMICEQAVVWSQLPLPELIEQLIKAYGLDLQKAHFAYLLAFRDLVNIATRQGEKGIVSFLNWWQSDGIRKTLPSPEGVHAVQVMTIHKSKGLAFTAVFVPFCNLNLEGKGGSIFWVPSYGTQYQSLGSIPLKYTKSLAESSVANHYFEESLFNHIDALNMLYVATTRARHYLYMALKDKKELKNISNVGDLLQVVYAEQWDEDQQIRIEKPVLHENVQKQANRLVLDQYPTTDRMSKIFEPLEERHSIHLQYIEEASRTGSILHQILANVVDTNALSDYIDTIIVEGTLSGEEKNTFLQSATEVLEHPELRNLLRQAKYRLSERAIVTSQGHLQRPDQVLFMEDKVVIIDYKFTFEQEEGHVVQVMDYVHLLRDMQYPYVEGYLFYAAEKKLKRVV